MQVKYLIKWLEEWGLCKVTIRNPFISVLEPCDPCPVSRYILAPEFWSAPGRFRVKLLEIYNSKRWSK